MKDWFNCCFIYVNLYYTNSSFYIIRILYFCEVYVSKLYNIYIYFYTQHVNLIEIYKKNDKKGYVRQLCIQIFLALGVIKFLCNIDFNYLSMNFGLKLSQTFELL